jgi:dihydroneopterin aldolase
MDCLIGFSDLRVVCLVGVYPEEKRTPQELLISVSVRPLEYVDYAEMAKECQKVVAAGHHELIETKAELVAAALKERFEVSWIKVKIEKPGALKNARCAFVEIER